MSKNFSPSAELEALLSDLKKLADTHDFRSAEYRAKNLMDKFISKEMPAWDDIEERYNFEDEKKESKKIYSIQSQKDISRKFENVLIEIGKAGFLYDFGSMFSAVLQHHYHSHGIEHLSTPKIKEDTFDINKTGFLPLKI